MNVAIDAHDSGKPVTPSIDAPIPRLKFLGSETVDRLVAERPLLVIVCLSALAVILLWPYRHFAGDDAYITFRFARNLATGQGYAFNPGVPVYGSTAPLWVFLIVGVHFLGLDYPDAAHALNWCFLLCNVALLFQLACLYLGRTSAVIVAVVLLIADPWFIRWSLSGMENGLALSLLMAFFLAQQKLRNSGKSNWPASLFAALAGLCRPEMCLLSVLLVADTALFERHRKVGNLAVTVIVYAAIFVPWLLFAQFYFGSIIPTTIRAKLSSDHALALVKTAEYFASFWTFQAIAVAAVATGLLRSRNRPAYRDETASLWFIPVAWALILPAFYVVGGAPVAGRYMMFGLPCYLLIGIKCWTLLSPRFTRSVIAMILATVALVAVVQYKYCWFITRWPQGMDPNMIALAETLRGASTSTSSVAGDQIGVLGYFSDRYVLDTYGLASAEILPYRKSVDPGPVWRYVHDRRPEFLFLGDPGETLVQWDPAYRSLTLIRKEVVQREGSGGAASLNTYYLYRTNW